MAGLKEDGAIVTCTNGYNHCTPDIRLFDGILSFEKILQQRIQEERERKRKKLTDQIASDEQRRKGAETELANLKGLFTGKRRKEPEEQIAADSREPERLRAEPKALR